MFNVLCLVPSLQALPAHQRQTDRGREEGGGRAGESNQRPYIIETMHSYTLPM